MTRSQNDLPESTERERSMPVKKVFVKTYGCQMNVYDSERMIEALAPSGYQETSAIEDADVIVLDGHPFHYNTFVELTFVNGKLLYDKSKSTYFSHIRDYDGKVNEPSLDAPPEDSPLRPDMTVQEPL